MYLYLFNMCICMYLCDPGGPRDLLQPSLPRTSAGPGWDLPTSTSPEMWEQVWNSKVKKKVQMPQPHQRCENRFQSKKKIKRKYLCLNLTNNPTMQACGSSNHRVRRHQREEVDHSFQYNTLQCSCLDTISYRVFFLTGTLPKNSKYKQVNPG